MFLFLKKIWRGLLFLLSVVAIVIFATQSYSRNNDSTSYVQTSDAKMVQTYNSERQPVMVSIERIPERVIANRINCEETLIALGVENRIVAVNMQNTDWQKEIYRNGVSQDHNVSVSGAVKTFPYIIIIINNQDFYILYICHLSFLVIFKFKYNIV